MIPRQCNHHAQLHGEVHGNWQYESSGVWTEEEHGRTKKNRGRAAVAREAKERDAKYTPSNTTTCMVLSN
jgi:hypothetical protein